MNFERVSPEGQDEAVAFLREIFQAPPDARFLRPDVIRWKFFQTRPDWDGSRSYAFRSEGRIVAHACIVPGAFVTPAGKVVRTVFPIDWAASNSVPGAGLLLLREIAALTDVRISYGGSAEARAVVRKGSAIRRPGSDYPIGELLRARRSLRPFARRDSLRALKQTLRDAWQNARTPLAAHPDWTARRVERFDGELPETRGLQLMLPLRSAALLNYMLDCPAVRLLGFLIQKGGATRGHLLLAESGPQARIADLVIDSDQPEDWAAAYSLAASVVQECCPAAHALTAMAGPAALQSALLRAGYSELSRLTATVQDRRSAIPPGCIPAFNMMDNDAAYLF